MKKQWISVKCGLSRDPKHRQQMGEAVWLFLHMLDRADWESGKVMEWKDEGEAEEMGMPVRTLREHRRKLEELDYISCAQKQYGQEITIHNWTNPREYSGSVTNKKQGGRETSPQKTEQGDTQGDTQGSRKDVTPTYNSNIKESIQEEGAQPAKTIFTIYENEIGMLTPMIADALQDAEKTYPAKWIMDAIHEAVKNNARNWKYVEAILKRWKAQGNQEPKNQSVKSFASKAAAKADEITDAMRRYAEENGMVFNG